ncbi:MAG: glycosyltransferase [Lachnospiraceae bacterium]|nr:glycosyltransferase [Lachnospiraceae bacterium]
MAKSGTWDMYRFPIKSIWKARKVRNIITRDPLVAFLGILIGKHVVLDLHGDLKQLCGRAYRIIKWKWFVENSKLHLVMITKGLQEYYFRTYGLSKKLSTVLPDGYTAKNYNDILPVTKLEKDSLNIGYCGSIRKGKGLELIQQLAASDSANQYNVYGGTKEKAEIEVGSSFTENVFFGGYIENAKVPQILGEQDVLLLPNQDKQVWKGEDIGQVTSPIKMFEYMASGRIIIASDLPVLREILNEDNCYFASANDITDWKKCICEIVNHKQEAVSKAQKAKADVKQYTWKIRAEKMLALLNEKRA